MTVVRRHMELAGTDPEKGLIPENLAFGFATKRYFYDEFGQDPVSYVAGVGVHTDPLGTNLTVAIVDTGKHKFEFTSIGGLATDKFFPTLATNGGLEWGGMSDVVGTGFEVNFGGATISHPRTFVPTSENWFFRVYFITDDASGLDAQVGFRGVADPVDTPTEITDFATLRILGDDSSALGAYSVYTQLNSTDLTSTALTNTLTDATAVELEVQTVGGQARWFVNGVQIETTGAYTFDTDDRMTPILRFRQTTDIFASFKLLRAEGGPLALRRPGLLSAYLGATD